MAKEKTKEKSESKMNNPALKGEVSIDKMLKNKLTNPRLRRSNVVLDGFSSCISYAAKEFSRTPEMSASKMVSQPGILVQQTNGCGQRRYAIHIFCIPACKQLASRKTHNLSSIHKT